MACALPLVGRRCERGRIDRLLTGARQHRQGTLVLRGEFGAGKTTLLEYAIAAADGFRVLRVDGIESEAHLEYGAVQRLLAIRRDGMDGLPRAQRRALLSVLSPEGGARPDTVLVGLGVVALLGRAARRRPLLCAFDDWEWLDRASRDILRFVAHRLAGDAVVLLFTVTDTPSALDDLPDLRVGRLSDEDARALVDIAATTPVDDEVRDRLIVETRAHPLALIGAISGLNRQQLSGGVPLPSGLPIGATLGQRYAGKIGALPDEMKALLLLAAAARDTDIEVLSRAAASLGIGPETLDGAEYAGLLNLSAPVRLVDPLMHGAIYSSAPARERRRMHSALADAAVGSNSEDHAWHRAAASLHPDEDIARELERCAVAVAKRGASARAASLFERSAQLTPDERLRAERMLGAAEEKLVAGLPTRAAALLGKVGPRLSGRTQLARARRLGGLLDSTLGATARSAPPVLLDAARALDGVDGRLARDAHLDALLAAARASVLGPADGVSKAARAARAAPRPDDVRATAADLLLDGFASLFLDGPHTAAPILRRALELFQREPSLQWLPVGCSAAVQLFDEEGLHALAAHYVDLARAPGATTAVPLAVTHLGVYEVLVGRLDVARAELVRARDSALEDGTPDLVASVDLGLAFVAAWRGREIEARSLAGTALVDAAARGCGAQMGFAHTAMAVLELGLGHYREALSAARDAAEYGTIGVPALVLSELVEAAARSGEPKVAAAAVDRLATSALAAGTEWALGMLLGSQALLADDDEAEHLYSGAIAHLKRCRVTPQLARARLAYGEWLRRQRRRRDAREQLRAAYQMFRSIGADAFAQRAWMELVTTGEILGSRDAAAIDELTAQEGRIARLATGGLSNPQIATMLQISPRTVEYHLGKVFRKLGITSRAQLGRALPEDR